MGSNITKKIKLYNYSSKVTNFDIKSENDFFAVNIKSGDIEPYSYQDLLITFCPSNAMDFTVFFIYIFTHCLYYFKSKDISELFFIKCENSSWTLALHAKFDLPSLKVRPSCKHHLGYTFSNPLMLPDSDSSTMAIRSSRSANKFNLTNYGTEMKTDVKLKNDSSSALTLELNEPIKQYFNK